MSDAFTRCRGKMVFVDVPAGNADAVRFVEAAGLRIQRSFTRMYRGKKIDDNIMSGVKYKFPLATTIFTVYW